MKWTACTGHLANEYYPIIASYTLVCISAFDLPCFVVFKNNSKILTYKQNKELLLFKHTPI